jgi:hypothetical protein
MNEELLNELSEAMKRRDKAAAAIARWTESKDDAEEDIRELSARITQATVAAPDAPTYAEEPQEWASTIEPNYEPTVWTPEQV